MYREAHRTNRCVKIVAFLLLLPLPRHVPPPPPDLASLSDTTVVTLPPSARPKRKKQNRFQYGIPYPDYFGYAPLASSAPIPDRLPSDAILVRSTERFYLCIPDSC